MVEEALTEKFMKPTKPHGNRTSIKLIEKKSIKRKQTVIPAHIDNSNAEIKISNYKN
ncbi:10418_t:CDS:1, partial [Acaulospora morrowiae]